MVAALNSGCIHGCSWAARSDSLFLLQWDIPAVESFQLEGSGREMPLVLLRSRVGSGNAAFLRVGPEGK